MSAPLLSVEQSAHRGRRRERGRVAAGRRLLRHRARRVRRRGRRIRQRQDHGGARRARTCCRRACAGPAAASCSRARISRTLSPRQMRALRGAEVGMVFQEPMVSLNPAHQHRRAAGGRAWRCIGGLAKREIRRRCLDMLRARADPRSRADRLDAYPHEFSGGMRQRIMLASVMLLKPKLLIADEPTTALDTLSQREVLELMVEPRARPRHVGDADHPRSRPGVALHAARAGAAKRASWSRPARPANSRSRRAIPIPPAGRRAAAARRHASARARPASR